MMQETKVRGDINSVGDNETKVAFKNCAQFIKCIPKIDGTTIDDTEDLNLVMLMYNLVEYSSNYSEFILKMEKLILMLIL